MQFHLADGVILRSMNGVPIENGAAVRIAEHWGEPDGAVALSLTMPAGSPIGVHVVEHLLRPDEIVGEGRFDRPGRLAPNVNWMSDRAMIRFSVAAFADPQHAIVNVTAPPAALSAGSGAVVADTLAVDSLVADSVRIDTVSASDTTTANDTATLDTVLSERRVP